jgi:hypothetical protein
MYASRPAREGEQYTTQRFPSGSIGLVQPGDCTTAVCTAYSSKVTLTNLPADLQCYYNVKETEDVEFVRIEEGLHHDGILFANGVRIPLHRLGIGVGMAFTKVPPVADKELPASITDTLKSIEKTLVPGE